MKILGEYENGNCKITIFTDGTRIIETDDDFIDLEYPTSVDLNISNYCENKCPFCYNGSSKDGELADLDQPFLKTMLPYTEIALNINGGELHPQLITFLTHQYFNKTIVNATIHIDDFIKKYDLIKELIDNNLIKGIGVSLGNTEKINNNIISKMKEFDNIVIHAINYVTPLDTIKKLKDRNLKILILGYKEKGEYTELNIDNTLYDQIYNLESWFKIVAYDNLAIDQLKPERYLSPEQFEVLYQGDEGTQSFYIDAVKNTFAISSTEVEPLGDCEPTIKKMFTIVKAKK